VVIFLKKLKHFCFELLSVLEEILLSGNLDFTVEYYRYPSSFLNRMRLFRGCLNKSVIQIVTELGNPEDQEAPTTDIKIGTSKSISSTNRQKEATPGPQ